MLQGVKGHSNSFSASSASKILLGRGWLRIVLSRRMALKTHNLPSGRLKNDCVEVDEGMFKGVKGQANSFSASWALKQATWTKSIK
jgi:hypothetical protein